jgi:hypothetical protein
MLDLLLSLYHYTKSFNLHSLLQYSNTHVWTLFYMNLIPSPQPYKFRPFKAYLLAASSSVGRRCLLQREQDLSIGGIIRRIPLQRIDSVRVRWQSVPERLQLSTTLRYKDECAVEGKAIGDNGAGAIGAVDEADCVARRGGRGNGKCLVGPAWDAGRVGENCRIGRTKPSVITFCDCSDVRSSGSTRKKYTYKQQEQPHRRQLVRNRQSRHFLSRSVHCVEKGSVHKDETNRRKRTKEARRYCHHMHRFGKTLICLLGPLRFQLPLQGAEKLGMQVCG